MFRRITVLSAIASSSIFVFTIAARATGLDDAKAGLAALNTHQYSSAVELFTSALKTGKLSLADQELAHLERAKAYIGEQKPDLAIADLGTAISLDPNDKEAVNLLKQVTSPSTRGASAPARVSGQSGSAPPLTSALKMTAQKQQAMDLFKTALQLWQRGNYDAAEIGFKQGLDLDPTDAAANYFFADCLLHRKDDADAKEYLNRAIDLGGSTSEGLLAQAALKRLNAPPDRNTPISSLSPAQLQAAFSGNWKGELRCAFGTDTINISIQPGANDAYTIKATTGGIGSFDTESIKGDTISLAWSNWFAKTSFKGRLISVQRIEGTYTPVGQPDCPWHADKQ